MAIWWHGNTAADCRISACGLAQTQQWCDKRIPTTCSSMPVVFPSQFRALWCEKAWNQILAAVQRSAGSKAHISETCRVCGFGKQRFLDTLALCVEWHPCGGGQGCIILLSYMQLWVENNSPRATVVLKPMEFLSRSCKHACVFHFKSCEAGVRLRSQANIPSINSPDTVLARSSLVPF